MSDADNTLDFVLKLLSASSEANIIEIFSLWVKRKSQSEGVLFFSLNISKTRLDLSYASDSNLINSSAFVDIDDKENPICYSLLHTEGYLVKPASNFSDQSSYRQLFNQEGLGLEGLCIPVVAKENIYGVFVLLASEVIVRKMQDIMIFRWVLVFAKVHFLHRNIKLYQAQQTELQTEIFKQKPLSYKSYAQKYVDLKWVDKTSEAEHLRRDILQVSESKLNLLLVGPEGSGKKHLANIIHDISSRTLGLLVHIDCANFGAPSALEVELFGCKRGRRKQPKDIEKIGAFEQAQTGTLLLENINCASVSIQRKIYKSLYEMSFRPVGSSEDLAVNCRVICCQQKKPNFSQLDNVALNFYKIIGQRVFVLRDLNAIHLNIMPLAYCFLLQHQELHRKEIQGFDDLAQNFLQDRIYKNGARELKQLVFNAADNTGFNKIIRKATLKRAVITERQPVKTFESLKDSKKGLRKMLQNYETKIIKKILVDTEGNLSQAAKRLDLPRRTLTYKCMKLGIER